MLNSQESDRSGINRKLPQIPEEAEGNGSEESAISLEENGNSGDPELGRGDLHETSTNMEIDNQKRSFRGARHWGIGDSEFSGCEVPKQHPIAKCMI